MKFDWGLIKRILTTEGILQGSIIRPILRNLVLNEVAKIIKEKGFL